MFVHAFFDISWYISESRVHEHSEEASTDCGGELGTIWAILSYLNIKYSQRIAYGIDTQDSVEEVLWFFGH